MLLFRGGGGYHSCKPHSLARAAYFWAAAAAATTTVTTSLSSSLRAGYHLFAVSAFALTIAAPTTRRTASWSSCQSCPVTTRTISIQTAALHSTSARTSLKMSGNSDLDVDIDIDVATNLQEVKDPITNVCQEVNRHPETIRLVAVSKTKPLSLLRQAYQNGNQRVFGENYAQELVEKAKEMPSDTIWHFIGGLQSNKASMLVKGVVPYGTLVVETLASIKVANKLNQAMEAIQGELPEEKRNQPPLSVFVQVNTSGEDAKSGVEPGEEAIKLSRHIVDECPHLAFMGLMTIGAIGDISNFETLASCREEVADALNKDPSTIELSMGMSGDYQEAIRHGATNVRVGSTIFGERDYSNKK